MSAFKPVEQQVIVITGASSGIGLATAVTAAQRGATVALLARSTGTLRDVVDEINASGGRALAIPTDVGDIDAMHAAAQAVVTEFGRIDTWVNNAGVSIYGMLENTNLDDARRLFDTNFWGVVHGSLVALPHLRAHGGVLVNVGSEVSEAVIPLQGLYAASKHAVKGFTDTLRVELENVEDANVCVVLIQPTAVDTPFPQHARNTMPREPKLPTPQIDPEQVADAILHAAEKGGRDVKVGAMAHVNTTTSWLLPRLADRMSAKQAGRQQLDEAPRNPMGTLYTPGEGGRIHGSRH
ncbi:SDR family oxidoreductase [Lysobacter arvi]|uniref:SDR family oxidoreductase n=1 Tax=Lysobacter arvi TaxID=3038776 RepID=A0ABU1CDN0_9GAMM|nr:SDR family oxidoreductase [Lysobacter arvi]MDR0182152.1 SDR family oxidoreductase [Lysobacter arvi]